MQLVFLGRIGTAAVIAIGWAVLQSGISLICFHMPDRWFKPSSRLFRTRKWEKDGELYNTVFGIRRWKKHLPDGAKTYKGGFSKKHIDTSSREALEKFVIESCRAELAHLLAIVPFWVFGFFAPPFVIPIMFAYALLVNLPCMIAQRYNRPRVIKHLERLDRRARRHSDE